MTTSNKDGEEIKRVSDTMDILAKLIIQRRQISTQSHNDYDKKLHEVDKLINMILALNHRDTETQQIVDTNALDKILNEGVEIIERDNNGKLQKFALIPICDPNEPNGEITTTKKKKKKNKINCSYCKETGHTRAACPKRLLNPKT